VPGAEGGNEWVEARVGKLLVLLVIVTIGCGVATGVTVSLAPAHADAAAGY
jgi:hypothetical protein